jgi:PTS system mannitol-specific IIC component
MHLRERMRRFGGFMSAMVVPNIGAFIAWGLIAALFIPTGWFPQPALAELVAPTVHYLLPVLVGYAGGSLVHGTRGAVVGAVATMGATIGAGTPMLLAAMVLGPLAGGLLKRLDALVAARTPSGFEMLVNNLTAGVLGASLAVAAHLWVGPVVEVFTQALGDAVELLAERRLLPLAAFVIEPAKVLFLNNAINHGVLTPLGLAEAAESGKAIHFLLESNPGPGLGLLMAYWGFGRGTAKQSAPGAAVIHFFGGIHEVYFPYVLAQPALVGAMCAGGILADLWFVVSGAGLVAPPSPGSILTQMAMAPPGMHLRVIAGIGLGAVVTFAAASLLLAKFPPQPAGDGTAA